MNNENVIESKTREEIKKLQLANKNAIERSKDSIDKRMVKAILEDFMQSVSKAFEILPQTQAAEISKMLDMPDKVDVIEKVLAGNIKDALKEIVKKMKDLGEELYE